MIYFLLRIGMYLVLTYHDPGPRIINVRDFGCKADGVTDDTECIQRAIEFALKGDISWGIVSFESGKRYAVKR